MNYKIERAIEKTKKYMIIYIILWILLAIVFVVPVTNAMVTATIDSNFDISIFFDTFATSMKNPFKAFGEIIEAESIGQFFTFLLEYTVLFIIAIAISIFKSTPKNQYTDIEHGSSDWSRNGEQYQILSRNKGIVLAENNYLPVDKIGNVNVLVVGRFRFW